MPQLTDEEKLELRIISRFQKAMTRYHLIDDDDKILVGLSGGKDSLCLLEMLARRKRILRPRFQVEAIHIRMDNIQYDTDTTYLQEFCRSLDVPLHIVTTGFDDTIETKKPKCFLCSWHRRKKMFEWAQTLGCNKIALGHHQDDILHTALMNLLFQGHFSTMPISLKMKKMPLTIIRPLCLEVETDIRRYAEIRQYAKQIKLCPYETASTRTEARHLFEQAEAANPEVRYSLWSALEADNKLTEGNL